MPPREYYFPCVECGAPDGVAYSNSPRMACCSRCRQIRRAQGRNTSEVACRKCEKKLYIQVRLVPSWDGFCPVCRRQAEKSEEPDPDDWINADWFKNIQAEREGRVRLPAIDQHRVTVSNGFALANPENECRAFRGERKLVSFAATRDFKISNECEVKAGDLVQFDGERAIIHGQLYKLRGLNGAIANGWLVEGRIKTRFERDDVI